jgi:3-hydroxyisobutyrate dehydrogenase-like beta-hydroxyacid dehydrogenase
MSAKVAFVGLGNMGAAMARNVRKAGFPLNVFNRTREKAEVLTTDGAVVFSSVAAAVYGVDIVVSMVSNDKALVDVASEIIIALPKGGVHVSCSTVSPQVSRELAASHTAAGIFFVAAPVFGRPEAAAAKRLTIATAGAPEGVAKAMPVLEAMSARVMDFGTDAGSANVVKLCTCLFICIHPHLLMKRAFVVVQV